MITPSAHILICRTDNIGDVVLTLPIASTLKQHFPQIKISFLCRAYAAPVVRLCKSIDQVIAVEELIDPVTFFAQSDIDTILFAQPDKQLAIAAHKAGIQHRIGNTHRHFFNWLHCNQRVRIHKGKSDYHEAQLNFAFLRPLGIDALPERSDIPALYAIEASADQGMQALLEQYPFNIVIHPKSNGNGREWPTEHFSALAQILGNNKNIHFWVTGSVAEGKWIEEHASALLQNPNVSNVCGKFSFEQLIAFIHGADGVIASGTGPLHVSAALGQRTLGLFPPTRPMHPGRWAPLGKRGQILVGKFSCKGCKKKKTASCECMGSISPDSVAAVILAWLDQSITSRSEAMATLQSVAPTIPLAATQELP